MKRRRRPLVFASLVVVLAGLAGIVRYVWLPQHRPALGAGEQYGIDVSAHQGKIDWQRVAADGIDFAYIKVTEGERTSDRRFRSNWDGAGHAGIRRGGYHFFTLCAGAEHQAKWFIGFLPADPAGLAPAVDLELAGNCRARPNRDTVLDEVRSFVSRVETATSKQMLVYVGDDFEARYKLRSLLEHPLWLRRFLRMPSDDSWAVWQVHGFAHVNGIEGNVDLDVMRER